MVIQTHDRRSKRLRFVSTGLALLIIFVLLLAYQFISGRQHLREELHTEAAIIGANSSAALVFNDRQAASEILGAIRLTPRIIGGALYHADGMLFTSENDLKGAFPETIEASTPNNSNNSNNSYVVKADLGVFTDLIREEVFQDETRVGTLLLWVTYKSLYWQMLEYAFGVFLIGTIALLLTHRFTVGLRKKMALTERQLQKMAFYDQVTGLPNRSLFEHELTKAVAQIKRENKHGALLFIDVDDFKKVNDLCGHLAGDEGLSMIAQRLQKLARASDIVARVGGDEFAAILYGIGSPENAAKVANVMIEKMAEPFPTKPIPSHVGLSIGLAMFPDDGDDPVALLRGADMAMYVAKSQGKGRYQFFSEKINNTVRDQLQIEAALREALNSPDSGLWVAYQPQVSAKTRKLVGVEALMRWTLETGDSLSPGEFIPIAEKSGLIVDLGSWLLKRICRDLAEMRSCGIDLPKVAVNVSPRELTRGNGIVEGICQTLQHFGETVNRFQFELTENALMAESGSQVLDAFRQAGFSLAIDDFGSGYSSLGYLKRFQVSTLKIDQQFVQLLPDDHDDAAIVSAVIQMSKALGITVVAEGVETEEQADFLTSHGCDILQGFLISRPIPPRDLVAFMQREAAANASPSLPSELSKA